jgi:hypothetical protein
VYDTRKWGHLRCPNRTNGTGSGRKAVAAVTVTAQCTLYLRHGSLDCRNVYIFTGRGVLGRWWYYSREKVTKGGAHLAVEDCHEYQYEYEVPPTLLQDPSGTGQEPAGMVSYPAHAEPIYSMQFSNDGKAIGDGWIRRHCGIVGLWFDTTLHIRSCCCCFHGLYHHQYATPQVYSQYRLFTR